MAEMTTLSKYNGKKLYPTQYLWVKEATKEEVDALRSHIKQEVKEEVTTDLRNFVKEFIASVGLQPNAAIDSMDIDALRSELRLLVDGRTACAITGDQTVLVEVYTELAAIKEKLAVVEATTVDEETKRELKHIKQQIATLRAEGFSYSTGATYIPGLPTVPGSPGKTSVELSGVSYTDPTGQDADIRGTMMNELKQVLQDRGLAEKPEIRMVDSGPQITEFDPSKCKEAIYDKKTKAVRQCQNFKMDGSDYCHLHTKKKK